MLNLVSYPVTGEGESYFWIGGILILLLAAFTIFLALRHRRK